MQHGADSADAASRFPRSRRLLGGGDFRRVFERSVRSADAYLTVLARENGTDEPRLGLAIARKRVRRSVDRNRIKRAARESFRHHGHLLGGLDVVVMARSEAARQPTAVLYESLAAHWQNLNRRCKRSSSSSSASTATS